MSVASPEDVRAQPTSPRPEIPENASEDIPPEGTSSVPVQHEREVNDPDAEHRRGMDTAKLKFAKWLVGTSVCVAVGLGTVEYFFPPQNVGNSLSGTIDLAKLLATTGLGFIFGRSEKSDS